MRNTLPIFAGSIKEFAVERTNTVHLQGMGSVPAKPAKDFQVGEYAGWNYGYVSEVLSITPKGKTQLLWRVRCEDGKEYDRVVKADRLVAIGKAPRK